VFSNDEKPKKADSGRQGKNIGAKYDFDKQPWLQLICCAPVSGCKVNRLFWNRSKLSEQRF